MINDQRVAELVSIFQELADTSGGMERTSIVPNLQVIDAVPTNLGTEYIIIEDNEGFYIPALKVPGVSYANGDLVNVIFIKGTEPIAFQQGPASSGGGGGGGSWPFENVLTVGTGAEYSTVADAVAAASSGDLILADAGTFTCDNVTLPSGVSLAGMGRGVTTFTSSANSTTLNAGSGSYIINCSITNTRNHASTNAALKVSSGTCHLFNVLASGSNSTGESWTVQVSGSATLVAQNIEFISTSTFGRALYYNSSAVFSEFVDGLILGSEYNLYMNAGAAFIRNIRMGGGDTYNGATLNGQYYDNTGNLIFLTGKGESGGVWLHGVIGGYRVKYETIAEALSAASSGMMIKLYRGTYTITGSALALNKSVTIEGDGAGATIITSGVSNAPTIDVTANDVTLRDLTIQHTGTGAAAGPLSTDNTNLTLDNVYLDKTSGAATDSYGLWMYGGSATLKNGTRISVTAGTNKYGIFNTTADCTVTVYGGQIGGDTQDIYSARSGSMLNLSDCWLTNGLLSWAGTQQGVYQIANGSLVAANQTPIIWSVPAFSVHKNGTDQTIAHDTLTKLTWSTEAYDTRGWFASDKFTPLLAGLYLIKLKIYYLAGADQSQFYAVIYKNGTYVSDFIVNASGTGGFTVAATAILQANGSTDYFEAYAYQSSGSNKTVYGAAASTTFEGYYIGR